MDSFEWLDQFTEENLPLDHTSAYFCEEELSGKIERTVQIVIDKIRELILKIRAKYAQIKFANTLKRLELSTNIQIRCTAFLPSDVKKLLKKAVTTTGEYVVKSEMIYRKFANSNRGPALYQKYLDDMDKNNKEFFTKMGDFTVDIRSVMKEFTLSDNLKIVSLLTAYDNSVSDIAEEYTKVGNSITEKLASIKKIPVKEDSNSILYDATERACSRVAAIYATFTETVNSLFDGLLKSGNDIIAKVAISTE